MLTKKQLESLGYVYFNSVGSFYRLGLDFDGIPELEMMPAHVSGGGYLEESQHFDGSDCGANGVGFNIYIIDKIACLKRLKPLYPTILKLRLDTSTKYTGEERAAFIRGLEGTLD